MGSSKAVSAEITEVDEEENVGRLEIHVKRFLAVNANAQHHSTGVSYFKCSIDERTKNMLVSRVPKRYFGAILPHMRSVAFYISPARPNSSIGWVLTIGSESITGFTKYTDDHCMFIVKVTREEYFELKEWLDPSIMATGFDVEFDFEPITNPRDYRCAGSRVAHLMGGH